MKLRSLTCNFVKQNNGNERWETSGEKYKAAGVWSVIRPKKGKVTWHKLVWSTFNVPKHAFISWLAVQNRLPTKDRLRAWGIVMDGRCAFCNEHETRDHLFFGCPFTKELWTKVLQMSGLQRKVLTWDQELEWAVKKLRGKALISNLLKIAWSALIYNIWRERNCRTYAQKTGSPEQILNNVIEAVRCRLSRLTKVKNDAVNNFLYKSWGLHDSIFT